MKDSWALGLPVCKLVEDAILPTKAHASDAGFDLYANEFVYIDTGSRKLVSTGISMEIPDEYVGLIWPRSGLAVKKGVMVMAGVIDSAYRGDIKICLYNSNPPSLGFDDLDYNGINISKGDKIAQILIQPVPRFQIIERDSLSKSERGTKGFGSSG